MVVGVQTTWRCAYGEINSLAMVSIRSLEVIDMSPDSQKNTSIYHLALTLCIQGGNRDQHRRGLPASVDRGKDASYGDQPYGDGRVGD